MANAIKAVAIAKIITVWLKVLTRPILSPKIPKVIPPTNIPKLVIVEIKPASPPDKWRSAIIELIANDKKSTSIFSSAKPDEVDAITHF